MPGNPVTTSSTPPVPPADILHPRGRPIPGGVQPIREEGVLQGHGLLHPRVAQGRGDGGGEQLLRQAGPVDHPGVPRPAHCHKVWAGPASRPSADWVAGRWRRESLPRASLGIRTRVWSVERPGVEGFHQTEQTTVGDKQLEVGVGEKVQLEENMGHTLKLSLLCLT